MLVLPILTDETAKNRLVDGLKVANRAIVHAIRCVELTAPRRSDYTLSAGCQSQVIEPLFHEAENQHIARKRMLREVQEQLLILEWEVSQ